VVLPAKYGWNTEDTDPAANILGLHAAGATTKPGELGCDTLVPAMFWPFPVVHSVVQAA